MKKSFGPGILYLALVIVLLVPAAGKADDCAPLLSDRGTTLGVNTVGITTYSAGGSIDSIAVSAGAGMWSQTCSGNMPSFSTSTAGNIGVSIYFYDGVNDGRVAGCGSGCGCTTTNTSDGTVTSGTVHLFERNAFGADCTAHRSTTIAHELGHILGFANIDSANYSMCSGRIMGPPSGGAQDNRAVGSEDCMAGDDLWFTRAEADSGGEPGDGQGPCGV